MLPKYHVIETTDLRTRAKSFKIYELPLRSKPPVMVGLATRAEAEAKIRELEQAEAESKP